MVVPFPLPQAAVAPAIQQTPAQILARHAKIINSVKFSLTCQILVAIARAATPHPFSGLAEVVIASSGFWVVRHCVPFYVMLFALFTLCKSIVAVATFLRMVVRPSFGYSIHDPYDGFYYLELQKFHLQSTREVLAAEGLAFDSGSLGEMPFPPWRVHLELSLCLVDALLAIWVSYLTWQLYKRVHKDSQDELDNLIAILESTDALTPQPPSTSSTSFKAFQGEGHRIGSIISSNGAQGTSS
eukprot:Selendium_serpulae@DN6347_c0_g1_i4.p1